MAAMWTMSTADTDSSLYLEEGSYRHITFLISWCLLLSERLEGCCVHMMDTECSRCHCMVWKQMFRAQCLSFGLGGTGYVCQQAFYWQLCHLAAWCTHDIILIISGKHDNSVISAKWYIFPEMQSSQPVTVMSCCPNGNQSEKGWKTWLW